MKKVENMLAAALGRPEVLKMARAQIVMQRWNEVVGEAIADRSFPDRFDQGTLWVVATGSAWAQEIRLRKEEILERLNALANEPKLFVDVRVGVRPFRVR